MIGYYKKVFNELENQINELLFGKLPLTRYTQKSKISKYLVE